MRNGYQFYREIMICVLLLSPSASIAVTTEDLNTAKPIDLFRRVQDACRQNNQALLFAQFSKSFDWAIKTKPHQKNAGNYSISIVVKCLI